MQDGANSDPINWSKGIDLYGDEEVFKDLLEK
jgi:hypothetical protein